MSQLKVDQLDALPGWRLRLQFSDGRSGEVNLLPVIREELPPVFGALLDDSAFRLVSLENGTANWPGELDLAPEFLYFCTFRNESSLRAQFERWGYLAGVITEPSAIDA